MDPVAGILKGNAVELLSGFIGGLGIGFAVAAVLVRRQMQDELDTMSDFVVEQFAEIGAAIQRMSDDWPDCEVEDDEDDEEDDDAEPFTGLRPYERN
jgi:hypothetical protein